jgi:hypothetical protein
VFLHRSGRGGRGRVLHLHDDGFAYVYDEREREREKKERGRERVLSFFLKSVFATLNGGICVFSLSNASKERE